MHLINRSDLFYLAGLLESRLNILPMMSGNAMRYNNLVFTLSSPSLHYFILLNKAFGIPFYRPDSPGNNYTSRISLRTLHSIASTYLISLNTPFQQGYQELGRLISLKDSYRSYPLEEYRSAVASKIDTIPTLFRATQLYPFSNHDYLAGVIDGEDVISFAARIDRSFDSIVSSDSFTAKILQVEGRRERSSLSAKHRDELRLLASLSRLRAQYYAELISWRCLTVRKETDPTERLRELRYEKDTRLLLSAPFSDKSANVKESMEKASLSRAAREEKQQKRAQRRELAYKQESDQKARVAHRIYVNLQNETLIKEGKKMCVKCDRVTPLSHYYTESARPDGVSRYCKECIIEHHVEPHRERKCAQVKRYLKNHPEKVAEYRRKNADKIHHRLRYSAACRLRKYLDKTLIESMSCEELFGCSPECMRQHFVSRFTPGMTWENRGIKDGWHTDHVIPFSAFDQSNADHRKWCWDYRNLCPAWGRDNVRKSDKIKGISVRQYRASKRFEELNQLVGSELECLGITTKTEYLASLAPFTSVVADLSTPI